MSNIKALLLFSGGLDSMLAAKVLMAQGIRVEGVCFVSNFYNQKSAIASAEKVGIKLRIEDVREDMLELVKNPPSGYGKNMNPCIDCHAMMIRKAGAIKGFDFVASGEVLGQRPFSQNRQALSRVSKLSGVDVVRPLSAKLLPETEAEKKGLVIRGRLLRINGRTREAQEEEIKKYGIDVYPSPAGGCLLTDPGFSQRLIRMMDYWITPSVDDIELLKYGRVYWLIRQNNDKILIIIGRDEEDNENLDKHAKRGDILVQLKDDPGPTTLIRYQGEDINIKQSEVLLDIPMNKRDIEVEAMEKLSDDKILEIAGLLTGWHITGKRGGNYLFEYTKINK